MSSFDRLAHIPGWVILEPADRHLHGNTSRRVNKLVGTSGRKTWHNFWDTKLTCERSYLARLTYVHQNAVRHGLVPVANQHPWCSAGWFDRTATPAQINTTHSFHCNNVKEADEFDPRRPALFPYRPNVPTSLVPADRQAAAYISHHVKYDNSPIALISI